MFRKLPPIPALAAFEAVARHRSFAHAAEELGITQSAVSHRIKAIEQHFGAKLLVRSRSSVTLTAQGRILLGAVVESLSMLEAACAGLSGTRKVVKLSVGPGFARNWLVGRLDGFYRQHNDIDLEVNAVKLAQAGKMNSLRTGEADVAIRYGRESDWFGFQCIELMRSEVFPVCSPDYRGAMGAALSSAGGLLKATLLRSPRQPWRPWFAAAGLACGEPDRGPLFSDAALMLDAAARGQGVALARSTLVEHDLTEGRLVRLFEIGIPAGYAYQAICRPTVARRPEVVSFLDWIVTLARQDAAAQAVA